jgi:hypothetical protein
MAVIDLLAASRGLSVGTEQFDVPRRLGSGEREWVTHSE